ncbi:hypothetical protein P7H12_01555 [Paenibacillus larvae]|nr:hypothetical protein [Paenibacillus larvae]
MQSILHPSCCLSIAHCQQPGTPDAEGCENMAVITENDLRKHFRNQNLKEVSVYEAPKGAILTPSAKSFLTDHQIELRYTGNPVKSKPEADKKPDADTKPKKKLRFKSPKAWTAGKNRQQQKTLPHPVRRFSGNQAGTHDPFVWKHACI